MPSRNSGFSLIEILVAIAIISLLSSVILTNIQGSREKARIAAAMNFDGMVSRTLGDKLVAYWNFEDPANRWADVSGQGHNGSCTICPATTTGFSKESTAANFDGTQLIAIGHGTDYFPMQAFTICSWAKSTGVASGLGMTENGIISLDYDVVLGIDNIGRFLSILTSSGVNQYEIHILPSTLYDNKFHLLCVSEDSTKRLMYIDGILKKTDVPLWTGNTAHDIDAAYIGQDTNNTMYYFNGAIDDIRIYAGSITQP